MITYTIIYKNEKQNEYVKDTFTPQKFENFMERSTKNGNKITICSFATNTTQMSLL